MPTDYIAPFALWIVVRRVHRRDGSYFAEPACAGWGGNGGLAVFVSRLHACVYATLRNVHRAQDDTDDWRCIPLQAFDLHSDIRDVNGELNCAMTFAFACDSTGALTVANGAPGLCYIEATFDLPDLGPEPVFNFSQWAFDIMRELWERVGAHGYPESIDRTAVMDDMTFACALSVALEVASLTRAEPDGDHWTVYDAETVRWISTPARSSGALQTMRTIH
ncbi:hypothetical protein [Paraburkholderia adhaesiva]|uniref:hypothetical protein n=1 Tax=Paraburkholderia adhaesiva TaxID=2883244 RepID=UPI001F397DE8|nr:hypothetical protein [Paraburkholderia adhaesiva]